MISTLNLNFQERKEKKRGLKINNIFIFIPQTNKPAHTTNHNRKAGGFLEISMLYLLA